MTVERTREYVERYATDDGFRARLADGTPEERRRVLEEEGFGEIRQEHVERVCAEDGVDLDAVAGGTESTPMAAMYMEAMMAAYNGNSQDVINKGNEMK